MRDDSWNNDCYLFTSRRRSQMEEVASEFCIDSEEIDEITSLGGLRLQRDEMDFIHEPRKCMTIILLAFIRFAV